MSDTVTAQVDEPDVEEGEDEGEDNDDQVDGNGEATEPDLFRAPDLTMSGLTPEDVEQRFKAVRRSWGNYKGVVTRQLDFLEGRLSECPMCKEDHPGFIDLHDAGKYPQEVVDVVMAFLGFATEIEYLQDPESGTCQRCGGEGKVATGSKVKTAKVKICPACGGYGSQPPPVDDQLAAPVVVAPLVPVQESASPLDTGSVDAWNEPRILPDGRENPNFGKMPQFKVPVQPWGVTAGLTAQHAISEVA